MAENLGIVKFHPLHPFNFPDRKKAKARIRNLMEQEGKSFISIDFIFCSDDYLLEINKNFLNHSDLTDIITFNLSENKTDIIGEVYISTDRVKENAELYQTSFLNELYRVMFHGALHLCGYRDKSPKDKEQMTKKEDAYLTTLLS
jgi:probable rRNA maturation factor